MSNGFRNTQNLNNMFPHKYIKLYNTQEDWQQALDNREFEEVAVAAILEGRDTTPDMYQYSIRTTNNDNERLGPYNALDPINYFGGLEIIWGYWGWKWVDITYNGEVLHGGRFDAIKDTTEYPEILDGYRLQHINSLTANTPKVKKVGHFDASNIISASNAFSANVTEINTFDYPKLQNASNMFVNLNMGQLLKQDLNFPELVNMSSSFCKTKLTVDQEPNTTINFGKLKNLILPPQLYVGSISCSSLTSASPFEINKYLKGLENCYDYSKISSAALKTNINTPSVLQEAANSFVLEPTYTGTDPIQLSTLGPFSKLKLSGPAVFGTIRNTGGDTLPTGVLLLCGNGYRPSNVNNRYKDYLEKGLDMGNFDNITISSPNCYIAGFSFEDDDILPFYKKRGNAIMYSYCMFKNMSIEFDCTEGSYFKNGNWYTEFFGCNFQNCQLTLKNILNHKNISLSFMSDTPIIMGFQDISELSSVDISAGYSWSTLNIEDIDGVTFTNCSIRANTNISNCTIEVNSSDNSERRWNIKGNFHNVTFEGSLTASAIRNSSLTLRGEFDNVSIDTGQYKSTTISSNTSGDFSKLTLTNVTSNSVTFPGTQIKTPVVQGEYAYNSAVSSSTTKVQEINFQNLKCIKRYPNLNVDYNYDFDLTNNTVLTKINLGQGWRSLKIGHAKLVDKDSLYQSVQRRGDYVSPEGNIDLGELWLHRDVWNQYTDNEKAFLQSKFNVIKVVEDESETE